ncbi:MAG TPA: MarR family transcriptional regulator [Thermomicrobiales bacterium]|nr:MarR family transcriptional regulator [Thermomicrobiales bacterium]
MPVLVWLRVARIYQKIDHRTAETMKVWNISVSRFDVINQIGAHEGITQQELADVLLVTKGNITQLLDALEKEGTVERKRYGRTKRLYLTDCGRTLREGSMRDQETLLDKEFAVLDDKEMDTLLSLLRKIDRSLSETG